LYKVDTSILPSACTTACTGEAGNPHVDLLADLAAKLAVFDTKLGLGNFAAKGRVDLAGFGHSETGAPGVYIWVKPGD
jgi:hypothetical protein